MKIFIKIIRFVAGTILGLILSVLIVVGLDAVLNKDSFSAPHADLWLIGGIVALCVLICNYLFLIGTSSKKIQTQGIENLPLSISEFIDGVVEAMRYRRSVRADVRQELTDHFTDALAECETEEEKQQATRELIEEFGDIKLLGTLLRRAKKRCRPLWRTMVVRTFQFAGICFLLLSFYIGWFFTGKPQITTNYVERVNQIVRPVADDSQNAWPFYRDAAEKYVIYETADADRRDDRIDIHPRKPSELSERERQILLQWIEDNKESINLIQQGSQKPYYWRHYGCADEEDKKNTELVALYLTHLYEYKQLAQAICWKGLFIAEQGDFQAAFDELLDVYSFGDHLRGQNATQIEQLVAMSVEGVSRETILILLDEYNNKIEASQLNRAKMLFAEMIEEKDFTVDYDLEKMYMYDEAQRCFTQSRFGKSHLYLPRLRSMVSTSYLDERDVSVWIKEGMHVLFTHPDKEQTLKQVECVFDLMEKRASMTPASAKEQLSDMDEISSELVKENVFLNVMMPALSKVNQLAWRGRARAEATPVILAILQYQKQNGQYPQSLDALVEKGLLKEVPIDPFSDKPLIYRKTDGDFILYSVGLDFTDNGGTRVRDPKGNPINWRQGGDGILWPVE